MTLSLVRRVAKLETGGADSAMAGDLLRALEAGRLRAIADPDGVARERAARAVDIRARRDAGEKLTMLDLALLRVAEMVR